MRREQYLVGLDVGTSRIVAIVGEATEDDDGLDIVGIGLAEANGIRRGVVVNLTRRWSRSRRRSKKPS